MKNFNVKEANESVTRFLETLKDNVKGTDDVLCGINCKRWESSGIVVIAFSDGLTIAGIKPSTETKGDMYILYPKKYEDKRELRIAQREIDRYAGYCDTVYNIQSAAIVTKDILHRIYGIDIDK